MSTNSHVTVEPSLASEWQRRCRLAIRILAGFEFVLILATWPLWWGGSAFPAIPLIGGVALPLIVDRLLVGTLLSACAITATGIGDRRWNLAARITALVAAAILVLSDQHRLQAWHWLFMLGLGASFFGPAQGLQLLRAVLASVYVCSALSRISAIAHQGMSAAIVDQLLRMLGIDSRAAGGGKLEILCHGFNAGELIVGLMLIYPKTRRYGILSAVALHGTLLIALGPFGLRHHSAVLLWNLCFVCLIPVVFAGPTAVAESERSRERWAYHAAKLFVWLFPLSGLIGVADNWPSWQLYSMRPETWTLRINDADRNHLPKSLQPHVSEASPLDHWVTVRMDRWSLAETESPIYPEDRFQCDVVCHVINELPDDAEFRIEISEPFPWSWWRRRYRTIESRGELDTERERFVFH
ncbi:MAG TPA: hypothetical protein PLR25_23405 [Planctomycetaceae bacterium]|nr:hypothetical protein [Planctomycetaceae bacterium]